MYKRLVIKTVIICLGLFIIITSLGLYGLFHNYELDTEKKYQVLVAAAVIDEDVIIEEEMLGLKTIKASAVNDYMVMDVKNAVGMKALSKINNGDYIRNYTLLPNDRWYKDDDRIIILPMDVESRLANLIKKGSLVDIKISINGVKSAPKVVLSKVTVEDILDENGLNPTNSADGKKAFAMLVLNEVQRDRIYAAKESGKLVYELYCNSAQSPAPEEFQIPPEFVEGIHLQKRGGEK